MLTHDAEIRVRIFAGVVVLVLLAASVALLLMLRARRKKTPLGPVGRVFVTAAVTSALIGVGCIVYGTLIEPDWLEVTYTQVRTPKLRSGASLRIVLISDLHVDRTTRALEELPERVNALKPDVVLFTGDAINARHGTREFRDVLAKMNASLGRYAVRGNHDVWMWSDVDFFGGGVATELKGGPIQLRDRVYLCGDAYGEALPVMACLDQVPPDAFSVLAYHTPDLFEDVAGKVDLYLAGHTHGGQVRLPGYGALITMSKFDKKYEMGRYELGGTTLYVNRGIGAEGANLPRIRFLARPEISVIEIVGTGT